MTRLEIYKKLWEDGLLVFLAIYRGMESKIPEELQQHFKSLQQCFSRNELQINLALQNVEAYQSRDGAYIASQNGQDALENIEKLLVKSILLVLMSLVIKPIAFNPSCEDHVTLLITLLAEHALRCNLTEETRITDKQFFGLDGVIRFIEYNTIMTKVGEVVIFLQKLNANKKLTPQLFSLKNCLEAIGNPLILELDSSHSKVPVRVEKRLTKLKSVLHDCIEPASIVQIKRDMAILLSLMAVLLEWSKVVLEKDLREDLIRKYLEACCKEWSAAAGSSEKSEVIERLLDHFAKMMRSFVHDMLQPDPAADLFEKHIVSFLEAKTPNYTRTVMGVRERSYQLSPQPPQPPRALSPAPAIFVSPPDAPPRHTPCPRKTPRFVGQIGEYTYFGFVPGKQLRRSHSTSSLFTSAAQKPEEERSASAPPAPGFGENG